MLSYGLSLKFLRRFVDFSRIHVISGYIRVSIFVLVFFLTLILLNYLLTGLRFEYDCLLIYMYLLADLYLIRTLLYNLYSSLFKP